MSAWGVQPSWQGSDGPMFERRDGSFVHEWSEEQPRFPRVQGTGLDLYISEMLSSPLCKWAWEHWEWKDQGGAAPYCKKCVPKLFF